jgi:predicted GNAT superfamily acetyltransferase
MSGGKEPLEGRIESGRNALRLLHNSSSGYPEPQANIADAVSSGFATIEIPADISMLEREDFDMARKWREETRRVFSEALSEGFTVLDYFLENERSGFYLLKKVRPDRLGS